MSKRLYIIGNGFDKAHGIPSGYLDFRIWLKINDNELLEDIEDIWENNTQLWNDFERNLGVIDYKSVEEKYKDYKLYEALMAEREFRKLHPEFPPMLEHHGIEEKLKPLVKRISEAFNAWVYTLNNSIKTYKPILDIDKNAFYITFNYTDTLEYLYDISNEAILHLHGRANSSEEILFGHNKTYMQIQLEIEDQYLKIGSASINDFSLWMGSLQKNVHYNLYIHSPTLAQNINDISDIYVLGYSFNEIDSVYIDDIFRRAYQSAPIWHISYYSETDKERIFNFIKNNRISLEKFRLIEISDILMK